MWKANKGCNEVKDENTEYTKSLDSQRKEKHHRSYTGFLKFIQIQ